MAGLNLDDITVYVASPDQNLRGTILTVLRNAGFRDIEHGATLEAARTQMSRRPPDLLLCETEFEEEEASAFVYDIRHNHLGSNPFICVIMMTWQPSAELVHKVVNSGADDLLVKPISVAQVIQRVNALIKNRKGFMVTSDYIGPDRRRDKDRPPPDKPEEQISPISVPNSLRAKVTGEATAAQVQAEIDATLRKINNRKVEGHALKVVELVEHILPAYRAQRVTAETRQKLSNLVYVAEDTARRLHETEYDHVADLCNSLVQVSNDIFANWQNPASKDLKLLEPIAHAIETAFTGSKDEADLARQITDTVSGRHGK